MREIKSVFKFLFRTKPEEKDIIFYAEHRGYFAYFEGMIQVLAEHNNKPICYITSDENDPVLFGNYANVKPFYIRKFLPFIFNFLKARVMVLTMTDLHQFHIKRSIHPVHYVYAFHSMVSLHMMYLPGAFDHYDSILCVGPHHIQEMEAISKHRKLPEKPLIKAGYYRLERVYNNYKNWKRENPSPPVVLVAPSWGKENLLATCGEALADLLLSKGYKVIIRPHPESVRRTPELLDKLESRFGDRENFKLERSVESDDSLLEADHLICDCSGVALEYALGTERPVLFVDVPYKIRNEKYQSLGIQPLELSLRKEMGVVIQPHELEKIPEELAKFKSKNKEYVEKLREIREEYTYFFGESSEIAAEYIMGLLPK